MELQLFDSQGVFLFRIPRDEPPWLLFRRSLREASVLPQTGAELDRDLDLQPAHTQAVLTTLESALREDLAKALAQGKGKNRPQPMAIGAVTVDILGERTSLDLRMDDDLALSRTNNLVIALHNANDAGHSVRVLVVPDWPRIARRLASMLHHEPAPVTPADLRERLLRGLEEARGRSVDAETAQDYSSDIDFVRQHGLDDILVFLAKWGLINESSPGLVQATDKLLTMLM